jgi:hypothetical protein
VMALERSKWNELQLAFCRHLPQSESKSPGHQGINWQYLPCMRCHLVTVTVAWVFNAMLGGKDIISFGTI